MYKNSKRTKSGILSTYWHCKCECGRECDKDSAGLRSGKYISCGICTPRKIRKDADDLTGKRFGRLTVIEVDMGKREDTFKNKKYLPNEPKYLKSAYYKEVNKMLSSSKFSNLLKQNNLP